ncbi:MAG: methanogenesis marker protein Mmp4/MtxX [Methanobacteriota archaeon]
MQTGFIGIGVTTDPNRVIESILRFTRPETVICYTDEQIAESYSFPCRVIPDPEPGHRLITDLMSGDLAAAVRGTLSSNKTLTTLKKACFVSELERIVLLETISGEKFFLAPVGVDEGWTLSQKISLVHKGREISRRFGLSDQVGIISGGRMSDIGRHPIVDRTLADAELVAKVTGASHYEIRLEDAIRDCGMILAPDGISGNLIFRTILFAGKGAAHGAPVVNISKIFVDTSRVNPDYSNALSLAASMLT